jgi:hypothetical protein
MSLFVCSDCNTVDNTAVTNYAVRRLHKLPPLCSECDPDIGKWHGLFEKRGYTVEDYGVVLNPPSAANEGEVNISG